MKKITTIVALTGALGLSGGLSAADIASSAGLGLELGGGYYGFDSDRNLDNGAFGAIAAEFRGNSGLAGSFWWMGTGDLDMNGLGDNNLPQGDAEVTNYRADMTYYFSNGRWQPYLSLGINRLFVDYEIDGGSYTTQGNLGAGLKLHMSPGWFLRAEVRGFRGGDHLNDVAGTLSIGYMLGQEAKPVPVAAVAAPVAAAAVVAVGDSDNDGVKDDVDECPNTIEGALVNDAGCGIKLTGAHFKFDSDELNLDAETLLNEVAVRMGEYPDVKLSVEGNTDRSGEEAYNVDLSQRRAQAAVDYLVGKGVDASRFEVKGLGSSNPTASNDTEEGRAANRRVVFKTQ